MDYETLKKVGFSANDYYTLCEIIVGLGVEGKIKTLNRNVALFLRDKIGLKVTDDGLGQFNIYRGKGE